MDGNCISVTSQSHYIGEVLLDVDWKLIDDKLIRCSKKNQETVYSLSNIDGIRLCFHMGGRGSAAKYFCYFSYQNQSSNKQIISSANAQTNSANYLQYYTFVRALINKVNQENKSAKLIAGHGLGSLSLYLVTSVALLLLPYIVYKNHIITYKEAIWSTLLLLLLCCPMLISVIKFFPRQINTNQIPKKVLPEPIDR